MNHKESNLKILELIKEYAEEPGSEYLRFGQILANLNINEFSDKVNPENHGFTLRDIYQDSSEKILNRILHKDI